MTDNLVWGSPNWLWPAVVLAGAAVLFIVWSYLRRGAFAGARLCAAILKAGAIVALALCLIEPLFSGLRPRPGANLFVILADNSQSMQLRDRGRRATRGEVMAEHLQEGSDWQTRFSQDFDVRRYVYDNRIRPVSDFSELGFDGNGSALVGSLRSVADRYQGRPIAGVLLLSDGNATDWQGAASLAGLPPIYPVVFGEDRPVKDIGIARVSVNESNFEASPVTILVAANCQGYDGQAIVFELLDETDQPLQRHTLSHRNSGEPLVHRFLVRPEDPGISFFRVRVFAKAEEQYLRQPDRSAEVTLANNTRLLMVDRGGGPFRVLYVSGRPNWDFKFLRRAMQADDEVHLVGLVRIAMREPKFTFRGHMGENKNPLYRGFDNQQDEEAEEHDQPVLLRLGIATDEPDELRDGFPQAADQLFRYDALIVDDLDAAFFTQDQMSLMQEFVSRRGGGFLMLGGRDAFAGGKYHRTPIGDLLPVYVDVPREEPANSDYALSLTRDGWIQPWVRLRANELDEEKRIDTMPGFLAVNRVRSIKPGATVLAQVTGDNGREYPALVAQRFGKGRAAALLIADMWRWQLRQGETDRNDLLKSWRQTVRWLVADVPRRIEVRTRPKSDEALEISVLVRDEFFQPLDNATVMLEVNTPDSRTVKLTAAASDRQAGEYLATFTPRDEGAYRGHVTATAPDGSEIGQAATGWASQPATDEFQTLRPNRSLLERIAKSTEGQIVEPSGLPQLINNLPNRKIPITEPWIYPLWHQWSVLIFAVSCLIGEWSIRRWKGLP